MTSLLRLSLLLPLVAIVAHADIERTLEKSFAIAPGDRVVVDLPGGSIRVSVGSGPDVKLALRQRIDASSDAAADDLVAAYNLVTAYDDGTVTVRAKSPKSNSWFGGWRQKVKFSAELTVPAEVDLDLDTAGGAIKVTGLISGNIRADTSGGAIAVTGGTGDLNLDTSGGSISIEQAFGGVRADTSGGSIRIGYVGPQSTDVNADTSGGSITIGVDPAGNWDIDADTSGGGVRIEGLTLVDSKIGRSSAQGRVNAGGHRLRADTSGGSITIKATTLE